MLKWLLGIDSTENVTGIDVFFRGGWILALLLIAAAVSIAVYLYRSEERLSRRRRVIMSVCQGLALLMLIIVILEPVADVRFVKPSRRTVLVLLDTSRSMGIEDQRATAEEVSAAAKALGKIPLDQPLADSNVENVRRQLGPVSRIDLARAALEHPEIQLFDKLSEKYQVRFFSFDDQLRPEGGADKPIEWLKTRKADGETSQVGSAIEEAVARYAGQPIAGVVVISDFAWVKGQDPIRAARQLKDRGIPVYPVSVGLPAPPDVHLQRVIAPEVVFKGDRVPLRIQIDSHGYEDRSVNLALTIDGQPATTQEVVLKGGVQFEELMFIPENESGSVALEVAVTAIAGETTTANNSLPHKVRIIDEKIKVLYVEGMPRWEYRYLRWVLLRDPRLEVTFLMTQGDPALDDASPRHVARFPQDAKDALKFDLIILGDVPASYFNAGQMDLIDDLVKKSGGSLLMVAGPMAAPATYRDTLIETILPVNLGSGQWETVTSDVYPVVTPDGRESAVTSLSLQAETNERIWSHVRPMHALPQLGGAKSGATVLLSLPKAAEQIQDYPLVAWQRYGNGKSMFVATEDLWRMRLEVGDLYHARFWGQAIQFLTLSRLLGQNKQITVETERATYSAGEQVVVYANVLTESFEPVLQSSYPVVLERKDSPDSAAELELTPVPDSPGLYSGVHLAAEDGTYLLRTKPQDAEISNRVEFEVATVPLEDRVTAMQEDVVQQIAKLHGGKPLQLTDLATLPGEFGEEEELFAEVRMERDLWDAPLLFLLLVGFAGTEWYLRRRDNLV